MTRSPRAPGSRPTPPTPRRARSLGPARRGGQGKAYTSSPVSIEFASPDHRLVRADLEIDGIFHGEASYEGRVFLNNPKADLNTPRTLQSGYAGSFHIFGHGGCLGDPGHCEVKEHREKYDFRLPHPLTPTRIRVTVTKALREIAKAAKEASVTIVPVITAANELCDTENVFRFEGMRFVSYDP